MSWAHNARRPIKASTLSSIVSAGGSDSGRLSPALHHGAERSSTLRSIPKSLFSYRWYFGLCIDGGALRYDSGMTDIAIGYARCSTDKQDLTVQCEALLKLGVAADRIYTDLGLTGTNCLRPGLDQALAAVRAGDTLIVPKLDRLARSLPDARAVAEELMKRGVKLQLGSTIRTHSVRAAGPLQQA